jgi:chaperonin GroES
VTVRPLHDRILARRLAEEDKTSGGLFIPDSAKEKPLEAVVISVGAGKRLENGSIRPLSLKVGDKILIAKYSETEVGLVGKDHILLREDDVLAVVEETNP